MTRVLMFLTCLLLPVSAHAFCGFFVAKADTDLFNQASKVVMARSEGRTVLTMANDYQGDLEEFAIVIPVPEVLQEGQINVGENRIIDHIDAYTAPRLVEYFDPPQCEQPMMYKAMRAEMADSAMVMSGTGAPAPASAFGVKIEAEYTVGEYDIVILSAEQSDGLQAYLNQEGYKMPKGAEQVLGSYIKQDMKFFLAKVNLEEQAKTGFTYLRPLQVAYESEKFMLPIRLGTLNAKGDQDLILFTLTQNGRVETANYRTVKIPSDKDVPLYVKDEFGEFYKAMFSHAAERENKKVAFLEYAWDMGWCDPCAADPVPNEDLQTMGVWWLNTPQTRQGMPNRSIMPRPGGAANVFITRLHVRYNATTFPEDLQLTETSDRQNFQGRYVMRHPFTGDLDCDQGRRYLESLPARYEREAQNLSTLTGWEVADIRKKMEGNGQTFSPEMPKSKPWWEKIWKK